MRERDALLAPGCGKLRNVDPSPIAGDDARASVQVEAGTEYHELRGVMLKCEVELVRDVEAVTDLGLEIFSRYGGGEVGPEVRAMVAKQAEKRVGMRFAERERATWDHRKLAAGVY